MPEYVYQLEHPGDIIDCADLIAEHREAVPTGHIGQFGPSRKYYTALLEAGILTCIGVRYDGELVGYALAILDESHHNPGTILAHVDCIYVQPEHRPNAGRKLMIVLDSYLESQGVHEVHHQVMASGRDFGPALVRRGYEKHATVYCKQLGRG